MKKAIAILLATCMTVAAADSYIAVLSWTHNYLNPPGTVAEYQVYMGYGTNQYQLNATVPGNVNAVVLTNIPAGAVSFYVVAVGQDGRGSPPSNIATITNKISAPLSTRIAPVK